MVFCFLLCPFLIFFIKMYLTSYKWKPNTKSWQITLAMKARYTVLSMEPLLYRTDYILSILESQ